MVTGTGDFQALFQGLLSEIAVVQGQPYGVPYVKLTDDSPVGEAGISPAMQGVSGTVSVGNFPTYLTVSGSVTNLPAVQNISGSVSISNFPTYITTSGSVTNFPTWQIVSGTVSVPNGVQIKDQYGFAAENTPNDEIRVIEPVRLVGTQFDGTTLDTNFWTSTPIASGTAVVGSGMLTLTTTGNSGSSASVQSVRTGRYISSASNRFRAQVRLGDITTTNNKRRWGAFTTGAGSNGLFFEESNGTLSVVSRKNNSDTPVASAAWNGSTTVPTLTNANTFEIYYNNRKTHFTINGTLVHTITSTTQRAADTLNLPVRIENTNTGAGSIETLEIWAATIARLGKIKTESIYKYIAGAATTVCKLTQGKILKLILSGTAANVVQVVDNNTGSTPIMAVINGQNNVPQYVDFGADGVPFFTGLSIITSSAAGVTVIYE